MIKQYEKLEFMGLGRVRWVVITFGEYIGLRMFNRRLPVRILKTKFEEKGK